jgi:signal transduction histidine kinase
LRTRNALPLLFLLLVGVPVAAAAYLGGAGLTRERRVLVEREREAMERRASEIRDALVRRLQELYRSPDEAAELGVARDQFRAGPDRQVKLEGAGEVPEDVRELAESELAQSLAAEPQQRFYFQGDLALRGAPGRTVEGFRVSPERVNRVFLDPASPLSVVPRFDERVERVALVRDDDRLRVRGSDSFGLPRAIYLAPAPPRRGADPVLLPPGYILAFEVRPAAALATDLAAAGEQLLWALGITGFVVLLGSVFLWRAVHAESRLAARKAEFVNAVSHELRTPLTSIRMYADMLKEGWVRDEGSARDYFALISAESERLARLVNNVLDFSRIERGKKTFEMRVGDPAPVVREAAEMLRPYLREKGMRLEVDVPEALPAATFDRDALVQILVNLIDNACKHGKEEVRVEAAARDGSVLLRVLDRGPGVPAAERERIFDPFARGSQAASGGSGLGLALVRHYAAAHRGRVEVSDRDGGGAVFSLVLPAA